MKLEHGKIYVDGIEHKLSEEEADEFIASYPLAGLGDGTGVREFLGVGENTKILMTGWTIMGKNKHDLARAALPSERTPSVPWAAPPERTPPPKETIEHLEGKCPTCGAQRKIK